MTIARTVAETIAGEATSGTSQERWDDMKAIASTIVNRAAMLGVSLEDVVSAANQYDAYGKSLPPGTSHYVDMAAAALADVQANGPTVNATYYATPSAVNNLPDGLVEEGSTAGHRYFSDPAMRAIVTAQGAVRPDPNALPSTASMDPLQKAISAPYENNGLLNGVTSLTNAPAQAVTSQSLPAGQIDPAFSPNGLLSGNFPSSQFTAPNAAPMGVLATGDYSTPNLSPSLNSFAPVAAAGVPGGEVASVSDRMGIADPSFNPSRFAGPVASTFDPARFGTPDQMAQVMATPTATLDAPEAHPSVNNFADMAAAGPVQSPMGVQGILGAMAQPNLAAAANVPMAASLFSPAVNQPPANSFADLAAAGPVASPMSVPAAADVATTPALSAAATAVPDAQIASDQTGINSPEQKAMDASVTAQLAAMNQNPAINNSFSALAGAGPMASSVSAMPTGILGQPSALTANAVATPANAGILSGYQEQAKVTPAETAINGILSQPNSLLSSTPIGNMTPSLTTPTATSSMLSSAVTPGYQQYQGFVPSDVQSVAPAASPADLGASYQSVTQPDYQSIVNASFPSQPVNAAQDPAVSVPSLQTVSVADQPSIAAPADTSNVTVQGPATTNAVTQQQPSLSGSFPAAPAKTGLLGGMLNKGTLAGGLLGSLVAGPAGGVLGGLLGNQIQKSGGLTGLLGGQMPSVNNIGTGLANIQSVYGGAAPGTQATANNGDQVTSLGGGWTAITNKYGVTTTEGPNNTHAGWFGGLFGDNGQSSGTPGGGGGVGGGLF